MFCRADGTWVARVSLGMVGGRRIRRERKGFRSRAAAEIALASMRGTADLDDRTPLAEYLDAWLAGVTPTLAPRSVTAYGDDIRLHIDPLLGGVPIGRLRPLHVRDLIADRLAAGLAPSRVRRVVSVLSSALGQGVRDETLARNVAAGQRIRQPEREPFVLSPQAARALLEAIAGDRYESAWIVLLATGIRRGELLGLHWGDVDLDGAALAVRRQRRASTSADAELKTARSRRIVPLPAIAVGALRRQRGDRLPRPVERVFPVAASTLTSAWIRTVRRTGIAPMRLHDLRHGAATLMLATGTPMRVIADTLGHSSPAITANVYAHALPAAQRDSADRLDAALRGTG